MGVSWAFPAKRRKQNPMRECAVGAGVALAGSIWNIQKSCGRCSWRGSLRPGQHGSKARSSHQSWIYKALMYSFILSLIQQKCIACKTSARCCSPGCWAHSGEGNFCPPEAIVKPQILTHVIEGFVIQEGLEPFPVSRSSLLIEQPVKRRPVLDNQVINSVCVQPELQNNAKHADNSSDTEMEDMIAEETLEEMDSELLKCEFCGKMGYANEFLRSKRFCTMSCAKRYNVSCSKKFALSRWNRKPDNQGLGHRGRRPSGPDGAAREHILRQLPITYPSAEEDLASHEDAVPSAMTTRLRRQSERERERELRDVRMRKMPENSGLLPVAQTEPSIWTVDDVWAFIHSLPGCQDIADEFRAQEIDGQALLLLKEDHLMSAMNIKLGPALKICARINSLKES